MLLKNKLEPHETGWNTIMAHFVAQTSVYWVEGSLLLWLDVFASESADDARMGRRDNGKEQNSEGSEAPVAASLQASWLRLGDRDHLRPGQLLPPAGDPVIKGLQARSQQVTLHSYDLRAAYDGNKPSQWCLLLVQALSGSGQGTHA